MSTSAETRRREAARWLAFVDDDLNAVRACLAADPPVLRSAAYHCQQAAEKVMKGLLVFDDQPFRRTHDLSALGDACLRTRPDLAATIDGLRHLTEWGSAFRYPGFDDPFDRPPAQEAVERTLARLTAFRDRFAAALDNPSRRGEPPRR